MSTKQRDFDVLIIGAGLSGVAAAYHLQTKCPNRTYAILERREAIGGTWDLFRYPGIRSDSDMYTLGYSFRPWKQPKAIADGPDILSYVQETAHAFGITDHINFNHHVKRAEWSSKSARWTLEIEEGSGQQMTAFTCKFLFMCSGYYDYDQGYTPKFNGIDRFPGQIVHPQKWPANLDYTGRRVVVIGSGATAVTLIPALAKTAAHVTMVQRSPTYIVALPSRDQMAHFLRRFLPHSFVYKLIRWRNVLFGMYFYWFCKRSPEKAKAFILRGVKRALGPDYDVGRHFSPSYNPWQQRLCLAPDSDIFRVIKRGQASVITEEIDTFTERGLQLASGQVIDADIIVTATGLQLQLLGGMDVCVDGTPTKFADTVTYKGMMLSNIPNLALAIGYTNASWTLKCDLTSEYVCRILNYMEAHGFEKCCPIPDQGDQLREPLIDLTSGYIRRAINALPKQGAKSPWRSYQNYIRDVWTVAYGSIEDGALQFTRRTTKE